MFDITLYGHLTNDTIIDGDKETMSLGGLYNCWRTFNELDRNLQVGLMPTVVGTAEITIDRKTSTRTSKANLNETYLQTEIKPSRISHVLYLNELEDTSFLPNLRGIVSADLCKGRELDYNLLQYVDYLFVCRSNYHGMVDESCQNERHGLGIETNHRMFYQYPMQFLSPNDQ